MSNEFHAAISSIEEIIEDARNGMLQERLLNRSSDGTIASAWTAYLELGRTFTSFSLAFEDRIRALQSSGR